MNEIVAEVARRGRVTCAEYMELALYHPEFGYYTRCREGHGPAGSGGDFLTAPTASTLVGRTLAGLLARLAEEVGKPLCLVELGCGEGFLLQAILTALGREAERVVNRVVAVEKAAWARERVTVRCPGAEVVPELALAPSPRGPAVAIASELYDALPVHRVKLVREGECLVLRELYVEAREGKLTWVAHALSDEAIVRYFARHGVSLQEGQEAEVRLGAQQLHVSHLVWLGLAGLALVLDYGYSAKRLYDARARRYGTLVGYRGHRIVPDILAEPGACDITAHLNFDDLIAAASESGWESAPLLPLGLFLTAAGAFEYLPAAAARGEPLSPKEWAELGAAKRVLLPSGMGGDLKVLGQGRGRVWQAYQALLTLPPAEA